MDNNSPELEPVVSDQTNGSLADWSNAPKLSDLKADLENARPSHEAATSKIKVWDDSRTIAGNAVKKFRKGQSTITPRLIQKQAEWRIPALSEPFQSSPDLFKVSPVGWEDVKGAQQNELVLNNQFSTVIDRVALVDEFTQELVYKGTAILRTGWDYQTRKAVKQEPIYEYQQDPSLAQTYQQMAQIDQTNPVSLLAYPQELQDGYNIFKEQQLSLRLTLVGMQNVEYDKVIRNCPTVEVCNVNNIFVDPACAGKIEKASFVIYSFETSTAELKASGLYSNLEKINVSNSSPLTAENFQSNSSDPNFQPSGEPRKRIVAYEYWGYWDIDNSGVLTPIVATWTDGGVMIRMEENPYPHGRPPFVTCQYRAVNKTIYGEPDAELLKENQEIIGAVMRGALDLLGKSANSQTGFQKGLLDSTNKQRFADGEDYEYNPNNSPVSGIHQHEYPAIPASVQYMLAAMNTDAESLTGVKAFTGSAGMSGDSLGTTAAGVRGALDASSKREMAILRRMMQAFVTVGRQIIAMNAVWLNEQEVVRITDEQFVPVRRDDLSGDFDLKLTISTPEQDEAKAQELAMMLQTMAADMDQGMKNLILSNIARLRKMPDLAHQIENYQPQPDPVQEQMQQLQMQLLQSQINLNNSQAQENGGKAILAQSKVGTEQARASQMQAKTDNDNLNFLQTQNGVKHQQQMELEQARGDNQLASQALKQQGTMDQIRQQHNLGLLANHASTTLNHESQLKQMHAQASLQPKQTTGSNQ